MVNCHLYLGGEAFLGDEIRSSHFSDKKLSYSVYPGAYVLPFKALESGRTGGGVVTAEEEYISASGVHNGFCSTYGFDRENVLNSGENVVYLGMFNGAWGHCLTDNIRRLWFFNTEEFRNRYSDSRIVYTALDSFRFSDSFVRLLAVLGFNAAEFIRVDNITCYKNVIVPDESFYADDEGFRFFTKEYLDMLGQVRDYASQIPHTPGLPADIEKIFLTYSQYSKGKTSGEEMLAEYFGRNGFTVIAPEKYSFDEQLYIYTHCRVMASTVGSCSHNSIFMSDGAELILIPRAYYLTGYQAALNEVNRIKVTLVDSSLSDRVNAGYPWGGPFCFFVSRELEKIMGSSFSDDNKSARRAARRTLKNYYSCALQCERMFPAEEIAPPEYYEAAVQGYIKEQFSLLGISPKTAAVIAKLLRRLNSAVIKVKSFLHR